MAEKSFETKMKELDEIVIKMNSNDVKLDDMLSLYEKAQVLIKELEEEINNAKSKIIEK